MNRGESPRDVQSIFMQLDVDNDGMVSRDEWRRGWVDGTVGKAEADRQRALDKISSNNACCAVQ